MKIINPSAKKIESYNLFTYRRIRSAIGFLGFSLPFILVIFSWIDFFKTPVQPTISHYYYTNLREIFTGTLAAVGLFLIRYKGHGNSSIWKNDNLLTNIAGAMAIGIALLPTNPNHFSEKIYTLIPSSQEWLGWLHYGFAAILFLIFSLLAINVFTIGQETETDIPKSIIDENNIYRFCGYSIIVFIIMIPVSFMLKWWSYSTLFFEGLTLMTFGFAWLIKGRAFGDKGEIGRKVYRENNMTDTEKSLICNQCQQ